MKIDDRLLQGYLDNDLKPEQVNTIVALLRDNPEARKLVRERAEISDLLDRNMNTQRSDAAFLTALGMSLDGGFDGPDGDGTDGLDGDLGTGDGGIGIGDGGAGADPNSGLDPSSLGNAPVPDPASVASAASAGGTAASTGGTASAGILWAIGGIVAVAVGTTAVMTNKPNAPQPEPKRPATVVTAPPTIPEIETKTINLVAVADAWLHSGVKYGRNHNFGNEPHLLVRNRTRSLVLKFDLSQVKGKIKHASLRLYCLKLGSIFGPITAQETIKDWQEDKVTHAGMLGGDLPNTIGEVRPAEGSYAEIPLANDHVVGWNEKKEVLLRLYARDKPPENAANKTKEKDAFFASKEHENPDWHPVLILEVETAANNPE